MAASSHFQNLIQFISFLANGEKSNRKEVLPDLSLSLLIGLYNRKTTTIDKNINYNGFSYHYSVCGYNESSKPLKEGL